MRRAKPATRPTASLISKRKSRWDTLHQDEFDLAVTIVSYRALYPMEAW